MGSLHTQRLALIRGLLLVALVVIAIITGVDFGFGIYLQAWIDLGTFFLFGFLYWTSKKGWYHFTALTFINLTCWIIIVSAIMSYVENRFTDTENWIVAFLPAIIFLLDGTKMNIQYIIAALYLIVLKVGKYTYLTVSDSTFIIAIVNVVLVVGTIYWIIGIFKKLVLSSIAQLEKESATKDRLFSIIAHDLRSPLNLFQSFLNLSDTSLTQEHMDKFKTDVSSKLQALSTTVDDVLEWARGQMQEMKLSQSRVDASKTIQDALKLYDIMIEQKHIEVSCEFDEKSTVWIDPNHLSLAIRNIIHNSIKFTERNGSLQIATKITDQHLEISFKDNGIGMNDEQRRKIMGMSVKERSVGTDAESGSGLGLNLSLTLLSKNNCTFDVLSAEGEGTDFILRIPRFLSDS